jgi:3-hydroxyisobutyrate dehydrogenase-like beta-hydroxyacid dehydrogenase
MAMIDIANPKAIGFIGTVTVRRVSLTQGIGNMGFGMAVNLRKKLSPSVKLYVNDINKSAIDHFLQDLNQFKDSIQVTKNAQEIAEKADIVFTMLPDGSAAKDVYIGNDGLLSISHSGPKKLFVECGTIDAETTSKVAEAVEASGKARFMDCPVSVSE